MNHNRSGFSIMRKMIGLVKPLTGNMIVAVMAGTLSFLFYTLLAAAGANMIIEYIQQGEIVKKLLWIMIGAVILRGLFRYLEQYMNHLIAFKVLAIIRTKVFAAVRRLAPAKIESRNKGDLISMISGDIELLEVFYAHTISPVSIAIVCAVIYTVVFALWNPLVAVAALLGYLFVGAVLPIFFAKYANPIALKIRQSVGNINNSFLDILRGITEIMQFAYEKKAMKRVADINQELTNNQDKLIKQLSVLLGLVDLMILIFTFLIIAVSPKEPMTFVIAIASFFSFQAFVPVALLGNGLSQTLACGNRVLDLLEEVPQVEEIKDGHDLTDHELSVEFLNVRFSYQKEEDRILDNVSFKIEPGEIVGVKAQSGAGKSMILKLLMRFWDIDGGEILVDGISVKSINTDSLWKNISYMTQNTEFFEGSIRDNLLIAKPDATDVELLRACEKASILEYIQSLPDGMDTFIKELGDNFSGGERQRFGLARCFLEDAPILLLDEPTSNLDILNENVILHSIVQHMKNKTIILVSHRDTTMQICDRIINPF